MVDKIYTPPDLAKLMAESARVHSTLGEDFVVCDFAAGGGELLLAATDVWPNADVVATDIDPRAVRTLRATKTTWRTGVCDFLNARSRQGSPLLRKLIGRAQLVLLNPPFSCRGGRRLAATCSGFTSKCSLGLAFVVTAIDYLVPGGELIAVLPAGSLTSERDATTWALLRRIGYVEVVKTNGLRTFPRAAVRTVVVRFRKRHGYVNVDANPIITRPDCSLREGAPQVYIVRGTTKVSDIQLTQDRDQAIGFLHSIHLQDFAISSYPVIRSRVGRCVAGPMILLPRVGQPKQSKISIYLDTRAFMLSDCVIALKCASSEAVELLWSDLQKSWSLLKKEYVGSGARYTTIRRLCSLLIRLGYSPSVASHELDGAGTGTDISF